MNEQTILDSIAKVQNILEDKQYMVRPQAEKVPQAFKGRLIGRLFEKLVRMNDGDFHEDLKQKIILTLMSFSPDEIQRAVQCVIHDSKLKIDSPETLTDAISTLPILTIANQIGMDIRDHQKLISDVKAFAAAIMNPQDPVLVNAGNQAVMELYALILPAKGPLKDRFITICERDPTFDIEVILFNLLGLFFQALDGASGLIGLMLLRSVSSTNASPLSLMEWVLQYQAPIQNTRRFKVSEGYLLPLQIEGESLPFGSGHHQCPGRLWAKTMALEIVVYLMALPIEKGWLTTYRYKSSPNAKVVEFYQK